MIWIFTNKKHVTRDHNIIADGWAVASNPPSNSNSQFPKRAIGLNGLILGKKRLILCIRRLISSLGELVLDLRGVILTLWILIWASQEDWLQAWKSQNWAWEAWGGYIDIWTYKRTNWQMDECKGIDPCVLQNIGPLGALPKKYPNCFFPHFDIIIADGRTDVQSRVSQSARARERRS